MLTMPSHQPLSSCLSTWMTSPARKLRLVESSVEYSYRARTNIRERSRSPLVMVMGAAWERERGRAGAAWAGVLAVRPLSLKGEDMGAWEAADAEANKGVNE